MPNMKRTLSMVTLLALAAGAVGCNNATPEEMQQLVREQVNRQIMAPTAPPATPDKPATPAEQPVTIQPVPPSSGAATPANPPQNARRIEFKSMERGAYSGVEEQKAVLITDAAGWNQHWQAHAAMQVPVPAAPTVDFSKQSLIAVYMGMKMSGGYSVEVVDVQEADGKLTVRVRQHTPGPGDMVTMALTQPYQIVQIPKVSADTQLQVVWE